MIFEDSDYNRIHEELQGRLIELNNLRCFGASRKVFLVTKFWHDSLMNWLKNALIPHPNRIINASLLLSSGELDVTKQYKIDFQIVEASIWNRLCEIFGCDTPIARRLSVHPISSCTVVLMTPVVLEMITEKGSRIKTCSADWQVGEIRRPLCSTYRFIYCDYIFASYETNEPIPDTMTIGEYEKIYGTQIRLIEKAENPNYYDKHQLLSSIPHLTFQTKDAMETLSLPAHRSNTIYQLVQPKPVGLINLGNTCYFNATLQCLIRVPALISFVTSPDFTASINMKNPAGSKGVIAREFASFVQMMSSSATIARDPKRFRQAIVNKYPIFNNTEQHDAQEILCAILDGLHEDLSKLQFADDGLTPRSRHFHEQHPTTPCSAIGEIFYGTISTITSCPKCNMIETVYDPYLFLSLPIPKDSLNGTVPLLRCIERFEQSGSLDEWNKWKCPKCQNSVCATQKMVITGISRVLIIHLKRFENICGITRKVDVKVDYPEKFPISALSPKCSGTYKLTGVIFHSGSISAGHYTAAAIDSKSGKWYHFNDSYASVASTTLVHSENAYILFYQKTEK